MEPLSTATAFATIVGLLAEFKSSRGETSENEYDDFLAWLSERKHEEVLAALESNARLADSVKRGQGSGLTSQHSAGTTAVLDCET